MSIYINIAVSSCVCYARTCDTSDGKFTNGFSIRQKLEKRHIWKAFVCDKILLRILSAGWRAQLARIFRNMNQCSCFECTFYRVSLSVSLEESTRLVHIAIVWRFHCELKAIRMYIKFWYLCSIHLRINIADIVVGNVLSCAYFCVMITERFFQSRFTFE